MSEHNNEDVPNQAPEREPELSASDRILDVVGEFDDSGRPLEIPELTDSEVIEPETRQTLIALKEIFKESKGRIGIPQEQVDAIHGLLARSDRLLGDERLDPGSRRSGVWKNVPGSKEFYK